MLDRWDRKRVMVVCDLGRAAVIATLPFVHNVTGLVLASLVLEICTLLWSPAKEASVPNIVPSDRLTSANSLSLAAAYGTFPVAAVLFALLAQAAKWLGGIDARLLQDRPDRARVLRRHGHVPRVGLPHLHARPARRRPTRQEEGERRQRQARST